jgi:hypothetical protein
MEAATQRATDLAELSPTIQLADETLVVRGIMDVLARGDCLLQHIIAAMGVDPMHTFKDDFVSEVRHRIAWDFSQRFSDHLDTPFTELTSDSPELLQTIASFQDPLFIKGQPQPLPSNLSEWLVHIKGDQQFSPGSVVRALSDFYEDLNFQTFSHDEKTKKWTTRAVSPAAYNNEDIVLGLKGEHFVRLNVEFLSGPHRRAMENPSPKQVDDAWLDESKFPRGTILLPDTKELCLHEIYKALQIEESNWETISNAFLEEKSFETLASGMRRNINLYSSTSPDPKEYRASTTNDGMLRGPITIPWCDLFLHYDGRLEPLFE